MNTAERIIKPTVPGVFRTVFLYTGQGETTLLVIPTSTTVNSYLYVLLDSDLDKEPSEVNLVNLFNDLFKNRDSLLAFINTHPHNDHIGGIREVYAATKFKEVWHSNHKPGGEHKEKYEDLKYVIDKVGKSNEYFLKGTNDLNKIRTSDDAEVIKKLGLVDFQVLSPAEYLCDEIDDQHADERNRRIHEQCGVIKFTYGSNAKSILFTGDSDKAAWKNHITDYHEESLPATVLSASHHGSRTFFKDNKDDEDVYEKHLEIINPKYLIISAPKQGDSPHGHPHDDAIKLYQKRVAEEKMYHLGKQPMNVIVDIYPNGTLDIKFDEELISTYGKKDDEDSDDDAGWAAAAPFIGSRTTRIDDKPQG